VIHLIEHGNQTDSACEGLEIGQCVLDYYWELLWWLWSAIAIH